MQTHTLEIEVQRIHKLEGNQGLKAFVDIAVNGTLLIKGVRVMDGKKGLFVSMPREQGKDKKWYDTVMCLNNEIKEEISAKALEAYSAGSG